MADEYDNLHHMRNDVRDAHTNATVARILSILALIGALIALGYAIAAWNKANDAAGAANRALTSQRS